MSNQIFTVETRYDSVCTRFKAGSPRAALAAFLSSGKVSRLRYCLRADEYVEVGVDDAWEFAVSEPWAGVAEDHVYFGLA